MKQNARLAELALRLRLSQDFTEFWELVKAERDKLVTAAIYTAEGDPAEKRGAARALDMLINDFETAPDKAKKLNSTR